MMSNSTKDGTHTADNGDEETRKHVDKLMPHKKIKKRRKIQTEDGSDAGWEEYHDYIFPDEEASQPNLKLLAMAKKWKQQMEDDEERRSVRGVTHVMRHERARLIYKYALDHLPKDSCQEIYKHYTVHEKKFGSRAAIEDVIVSKRRFKYEEEVKTNPYNYDAWFDYLRLLEADGNTEQIRETYERAIANVLPSKEKRHWRRYIYLWINYAVYEELENDDPDKVREVFKACLDVIPHKTFTFAKIWLLFAQFEIRQKSLQGARRVMGTAVGKCPKNKLYRGYIELELQLREFERCRILYEKFLEFGPENCTSWIKYAELETILGDIDRAEAIYELAINQQQLDMPEVLWKSYIDFQIEQEEFDKVRNLYRRLLQRTKHVKVIYNTILSCYFVLKK
ncbi:CLF1 [Mytilus edulis]|uniref:CRN n=1 Tax=Mytilus edulis TaxID=6550 RepID=A0A8S3RPT8_MYTED|nr:CLF1 [Mytilus edulis]